MIYVWHSSPESCDSCQVSVSIFRCPAKLVHQMMVEADLIDLLKTHYIYIYIYIVCLFVLYYNNTYTLLIFQI